MIRPEIRQALWRWREVLAALALAGVGLWWGLVSFGVVRWLGWGMVGLGVVLALAAAQKVRFRRGGDGPGVVTLDERRVIYMGPRDGGVADLDLMVRLEITPQPHAAWRLINADGSHLDIPVNAAGADALFDVFNALPGIRTHILVGVVDLPRPQNVTVWRSGKDPEFKRLPPTMH